VRNRPLGYRIGLILLALAGLLAGYLLISDKGRVQSGLLLVLAVFGILLALAGRRRG
jgi:hypothetical protein